MDLGFLVSLRPNWAHTPWIWPEKNGLQVDLILARGVKWMKSHSKCHPISFYTTVEHHIHPHIYNMLWFAEHYLSKAMLQTQENRKNLTRLIPVLNNFLLCYAISFEMKCIIYHTEFLHQKHQSTYVHSLFWKESVIVLQITLIKVFHST